MHEAAWLECTCDTNTGISERIAKDLGKKPTMAPNHHFKIDTYRLTHVFLVLDDCVGNIKGQLKC